MNPIHRFVFVFVSLFLLCPHVLFAAVSTSGEVDPVAPVDGETVTVARGATNGSLTVGTLTINNGSSLSSDDGILGQRVGARGIVSVQGNSSTWTVSDDLTIGSAGTGSVRLTDGATLLVGDELNLGVTGTGHGTLSASGAHTAVLVSDFVQVNAGRLSLSDDAWLTTDRATAGTNDGSIHVESGANFSAANNIRLGLNGRGSLLVKTGGVVRADNLLVGGASGADTSVAGDGSSVLLRGDLIVGDSEGPGSVSVLDGALLTGTAVRINNGNLALSGGVISAQTALVEANGRLSGDGRVEAWLSNTSGTVAVGSDEHLHFTLGSTNGSHTNAAKVSVIGGELSFDRSLTNTGQIAGHDAIMRFGGGLANQGELGISTGVSDVFGAIQNSGSIKLDGISTTTFYDLVTNRGQLDLTPDARAVFLGGLSLGAQSQLRIPAAEPNEDGLVVERMSVDGSLQAVGILDVDLDLLTAVENPGDVVTIDLVSASSVQGVFSSVLFDGEVPSSLVMDADGRSFRAPSSITGAFDELIYTDDGIQFSRFLTLPGDANGDKEVGFADFLLLSENFGNAGDWLQGDFDGDGTTAFSDFLILSQEFGNSIMTAAGVAAQSVPEPAIELSLAWLLGLGLNMRRRRTV